MGAFAPTVHRVSPRSTTQFERSRVGNCERRKRNCRIRKRYCLWKDEGKKKRITCSAKRTPTNALRWCRHLRVQQPWRSTAISNCAALQFPVQRETLQDYFMSDRWTRRRRPQFSSAPTAPGKPPGSSRSSSRQKRRFTAVERQRRWQRYGYFRVYQLVVGDIDAP